jgi:hypothetical protein
VERGLAVARIDLERLAQVLLGLGRVGREPHVGLGGRHEQPGGQAAIGRRRRLLHVLVRELAPVRRRDVELVDRLGGQRVVGAQRAHLIERGARGRHVEQLAVEHHALLEQQVGLAGRILGRRQLDVEQQDHGVGPAAGGEQLARGG